MNEQAKARIDYRVADLLEEIGPLDEKGCVQNPDFDKAMYASQINALVNLRGMIDGTAPVGYPPATHAYLHDADMQRLRKNNGPTSQ
jgi:hypothetical protein